MSYSPGQLPAVQTQEWYPDELKGQIREYLKACSKRDTLIEQSEAELAKLAAPREHSAVALGNAKAKSTGLVMHAKEAEIDARRLFARLVHPITAACGAHYRDDIAPRMEAIRQELEDAITNLGFGRGYAKGFVFGNRNERLAALEVEATTISNGSVARLEIDNRRALRALTGQEEIVARAPAPQQQSEPSRMRVEPGSHIDPTRDLQVVERAGYTIRRGRR
jgi:hypothetical protein